LILEACSGLEFELGADALADPPPLVQLCNSWLRMNNH
ncbi:MAG: hypothetical protein RLZZ616_597, partial [Pseudomonadota bacterium]